MCPTLCRHLLNGLTPLRPWSGLPFTLNRPEISLPVVKHITHLLHSREERNLLNLFYSLKRRVEILIFILFFLKKTQIRGRWMLHVRWFVKDGDRVIYLAKPQDVVECDDVFQHVLLAQGLAIFYFLLLLDVHLGDRHGTVEGEDHLSWVAKVIFKVYLLCCTRRDERR